MPSDPLRAAQLAEDVVLTLCGIRAALPWLADPATPHAQRVDGLARMARRIDALEAQARRMMRDGRPPTPLMLFPPIATVPPRDAAFRSRRAGAAASSPLEQRVRSGI